jgi:hypothetical protein
MATASIESSVTAPTPKGSVIGASREDLEPNDVVLLDSVNTGTSYAWSLAFTPEGSAAAFSGSAVAKSPGSFTVDVEGPYLVRFQFTDGTGTTEQFVRLRALTAIGGLKLVAAGEGVGDVPVPVDGTAAGWADDQNGNLLAILGLVERAGSSGRLLYVDQAQGDYRTIQAAMAYADSQGPSTATPWVVLVRPGDVYAEDLTFFPHVHLFGWPGFQSSDIVRIRNSSAAHAAALPLVGDRLVLSNLFFERLSASSDALLDLSGAGTLTVFRCALVASGAASPQGSAILTAGTGTLKLQDSRLSSNSSASADSYALSVGAGTTAEILDSEITIRGIRAVAGSTVTMRDSVVSVAGTYGIFSDATLLEMDYCKVSGGSSQDMAFNPAGASVTGDVAAKIRWSSFGGLVFDTTGVSGSTSLTLGSVEHGALSFPSGSPGTLAASIPSSTLFFDNTVTGIASEDVQAALDEIWGLAVQVENLDDAYDGGGSGAGRTIVADQGAVQIVDASSPSDPIPAGNTNGGLDVVGKVRVGAISKPEISVDPNPFGNGPQILMGREIWANDAVLGSSSLILADASGSPSYHNYNLRVGSKSADGGSRAGNVVLRGGDSLANPVDAASVFIQAGRGGDVAGGDGGNLYLAPGDSSGGAGGKVFLVRPEDATAASIQAAGAFVGGVTGTATFATDMGAFEVDIDAADNLATVLAAFTATGVVVATDAGGGVILLETLSRGPMAEIFLLSAGTGLDTALGVFAGQTMTEGTYPSFMEVEVSAANEVTFGPSAANPMTYNATTGQLTVPGAITDPTYLLQTDTPPVAYTSGKGTVWVGDGTSGSTLGDLYFIHEFGSSAGSPINLSTGGGLSLTVTPEAFASADFTWDGSVSSVTLGQTPNTSSALTGLITISRNGVHDLDNVGPSAPTTDLEFRINGTDLEIGADITADGDTYRLVYPST